MTIWKFPLGIADYQAVMMPEGAQILTAQYQDDDVLCLWALVDPDAERVQRKIWVYDTGWELPDNPGTWIATVQRDSFVWHVFEREI